MTAKGSRQNTGRQTDEEQGQTDRRAKEKRTKIECDRQPEKRLAWRELQRHTKDRETDSDGQTTASNEHTKEGEAERRRWHKRTRFIHESMSE